jgi:hypothetical protein
LPKCDKDKIIVLNDQGGAVMDVSYDVTATLRAQDHGHPPVVLCFEPRSPDGVPRICGGGYCTDAQHSARRTATAVCDDL